MTWEERIKHYCQVTGYPRSMFAMEGGMVIGMWKMGNNYQVKSGYYGGYPATYLARVKALFPDKSSVLHLFSGRVDLDVMPGDTVDMNADLKPDYLDDAQTLTRVPLSLYDIVLCDPPYSVEDAEHYSTSMVKRNLVMRALTGVDPGTHIVWLDQVLPMYRKADWAIEAHIGMVKSTNHRYRVITIFCKK